MILSQLRLEWTCVGILRGPNWGLFWYVYCIEIIPIWLCEIVWVWNIWIYTQVLSTLDKKSIPVFNLLLAVANRCLLKFELQIVSYFVLYLTSVICHSFFNIFSCCLIILYLQIFKLLISVVLSPLCFSFILFFFCCLLRCYRCFHLRRIWILLDTLTRTLKL